MKVSDQSVVTIVFKIYTAQNELLEDIDEPFTFLVGGQDQPLESITEAVMDQSAGFETMIQIEPEQAFGDYDPELVQLANAADLPKPLEIGMQFEGLPDGSEHVHAAEEAAEPRVFIVTQIEGDSVVLDGNHPWAGYALRIAIKLLHVRGASEEELEQGYSDEADDDEEAQLEQLTQQPTNKPTMH